MNLFGKPCVAPNVLKADLTLVSKQGFDPAGNRMAGFCTAKIDTQRAAVGRNLFDIDQCEPMHTREAIYRDQRKIREMLVIDRIKLVVVDESLQMRELERCYAIWREKVG